MMRHLVFVYGTLRKGEKNHYLIRKAECVERNAYTHGKLYDTGFHYPAMVLDEDEKVYGELYRVDDDMLEILYRLEGYEPGRESNLYETIEAEVFSESGSYEAILFVAGNQTDLLKKRIPSGDWILYKRT
ncbi:gamma-glutamylcyclotransferase family protein [Ectobacillus panaciterrae]|uniref:gamma-glutamylcyclotransferase family protein n=1 Tax=Ectobacillus panaciterrae TaxID=363872 RepID=UPI000408F845|nr:gamma-glutamylcyclotransferase family protein [Ectobacillus panaciterrae]